MPTAPYPTRQHVVALGLLATACVLREPLLRPEFTPEFTPPTVATVALDVSLIGVEAMPDGAVSWSGQLTMVEAFRPKLCASAPPNALALDAGGQTVAVVHDHGVEVFDTQSGQRLAVLHRPQRQRSRWHVRDVYLAGDRLWMNGAQWAFRSEPEPTALEVPAQDTDTAGLIVDNALRGSPKTVAYAGLLWDAETGRRLDRVLEAGEVALTVGESGRVALTVVGETHCGQTPDFGGNESMHPHLGERWCSYSPKLLRLRDVKTGRSLLELHPDLVGGGLSRSRIHTTPVAAAFVPNNGPLAIANGSTVSRVRRRDGAVECSVISAEPLRAVALVGETIVVVRDSQTDVWRCDGDSSRAAWVKTLPGVALPTPDRARLLTVKDDERWIYDTTTEVTDKVAIASDVALFTVSAGAAGYARGACLAVASIDGVPEFSPAALLEPVAALAFSGDSAWLAAADAAGRVWMLPPKAPQMALRCPERLVNPRLIFSADGEYLNAYGGWHGCRWPVQRGGDVRVVSAQSLAGISANGPVFVRHPNNKGSAYALDAVDIESGKVSKVRGVPEARTYRVSGDGRTLLMYAEQHYRLVSLDGAQERTTPAGADPNDFVASVDLAAVAFTDKSAGGLRVWTPQADQDAIVALQLDGEQRALAVSANGKWVATAAESSVWVVAVASGIVLGAITLIDDEPTVAAFAPDGTTLAVGTARGGVMRLTVGASSADASRR